jgi:hypothetical protein
LNPPIPGRNVEEFLLPLRGKNHLLLHLTEDKRGKNIHPNYVYVYGPK